METHFHRLAAVRHEYLGIIPSTAASPAFKGLRLRDDSFVAASPPETFVIVCASGLIGFVGLHLGFAEILHKC